LVKKLLNPYPPGFIPSKFIDDNVLALSMVLEQAKSLELSVVGILLDQEKVCDRINAGNLKSTLHKFAFPQSSLIVSPKLFFGNKVQININGSLLNLSYKKDAFVRTIRCHLYCLT
jgi:hypothetical protein